MRGNRHRLGEFQLDIREKNLSWRWSNAETGCHEWPRHLRPWRCSRLDWTNPWAIWSN